MKLNIWNFKTLDFLPTPKEKGLPSNSPQARGRALMTSDLTFRRSHHHHHPPAASYYNLKFIRQFNFYKHLSSMELKMNWPGCIQSQLKISTNLSFLSKFDETYFFALLPAPASRKPFANGLLSIFSCVICKVFVILKLGDQQLDLKIICYFSAEIFNHQQVMGACQILLTKFFR